MEFRAFIKIFADQRNLFFGVWLGLVLIAALVWRFQPTRYEASLLVNVSRTGTEMTDAYRYDHFYRLQADERFADTVVRWLSASSILKEISRESEAPEDIVETIVAKRLSSQVIDIRYRARSAEAFRGFDQAIVSVLNREAEKLNESSNDPNWFMVVADTPVIKSARIPFWKVLLAGAVGGVFFAFWTVMARWYWVK